MSDFHDRWAANLAAEFATTTLRGPVLSDVLRYWIDAEPWTPEQRRLLVNAAWARGVAPAQKNGRLVTGAQVQQGGVTMPGALP